MQKTGIFCVHRFARNAFTHQNWSFIMKTSAIIIVGVLLTAQLLIAGPTKGQGAGNKTVSIHLTNASLVKVFNIIEEKTGVVIMYEDTELTGKGNVSINMDDARLADVMEFLLKDKNLNWSLRGNIIRIEKKTDFRIDSIATNLSAAPTFFAHPPITVKGRIVNENGEPVIASVTVKGTTKGTTSNANGEFELNNVNDDAMLVITATNIETVTIGARNELNIFVKTSASSLNEVVVNKGYYSEAKKISTGNISKITSNEIQKQPVQNPLQALQGRIAGLDIVQQTGVPGGNFTVRVRGQNSLRQDANDPLYIVDGVPFVSSSFALAETSGQILGSGTNPLNAINPTDILSIEVLKDADATAIYGSRGANGVILITTKSGKIGKMNVNMSFYHGFGDVAEKINLLNTQQYLSMRNEAFKNDNVTPTTSNARDLKAWDTTRYTDWQKELIGGTANITDMQTSISNGNERIQFLIGAGYHRETTVFPGKNADKRLSLHSNLSSLSSNKKFKITMSVNYSINESDLLSEDLTDNALFLPPVAPTLYDDQGNMSWENWSSSYENPIAYTKRPYNSNTRNLIGNVVLQYNILPNLDVRSNLGYTNINMKANTILPISSQDPNSFPQNSTYFATSAFDNWVIEPQLNWRPVLGSGRFNMLLGTTFLDQQSEKLGQGGFGYTSESLMNNLISAPFSYVSTDDYAQYKYQAVFGRINYALFDRYFINLTGRRDGSSRFGKGKQFANFGALGMAWIFSEENFFNKTSLISFGKLRVSYGITGNDQIGDYQYLDTYSSNTSGRYLTGIGLAPDRLSNAEFGWETNKKMELGIELGFLKNKITASISYYQNKSSNQLVGFPLPAITGFPNVQGNFPATVKNTGVEIEVFSKNIETSNFSWTISLNLTVPKNRLASFPNIEAFPAYGNMYVVGQSLNIRKLYNYTGLDPATGVYTFEDVNKDGVFNTSDRIAVGFTGRKLFGGVQNAVRIKNIQIDFLLQFAKQSVPNYLVLFASPGRLGNISEESLNRWQNVGDDSEFQRFGQAGSTSTPYSRYTNSTQSITNADFIKLKNISISYNLPVAWMKRLKFENTRVFIQGQNVLTFTKYRGFDPETTGTQLPSLRVISGGISLNL